MGIIVTNGNFQSEIYEIQKISCIQRNTTQDSIYKNHSGFIIVVVVDSRFISDTIVTEVMRPVGSNIRLK